MSTSWLKAGWQRDGVVYQVKGWKKEKMDVGQYACHDAWSGKNDPLHLDRFISLPKNPLK